MVQTNLRASIAICTYNGEQFIEEELKSMIQQSIQPNEIVLFDDGSTDNTLTIAKSVLLKSNIPFEIHQNETNLGILRNFEQCALACTGDVIFFSDQDDIWKNNKIEKMLNIFQTNSKVQLVFTNADIKNEKYQATEKRLWSTLDIYPNSNQLNLFNNQLKSNCVTGATMAIRKSAFLNALPFSELWVHDEWLAAKSMFYGEIYPLNEPLMYYRIHQNNALGLIDNSLDYKHKRFISDLAKAYKIRIDKFEKLMDLKNSLNEQEGINQQYYQQLSNCIDFWKREINLLNQSFFGKIKIVLKNLFNGDYYLFSSGLSALIKDFIFIFKG